MKIGGAVVTGSGSELPSDLLDVYIKLGETLSDNMIPIPLDEQGQVEIRLEGWSKVISITGTSAKLELVGEATYVEEFRP